MLRDGVEFHNGKTMTSEDVVASLNHHRGEGTKSVGAPILAAVADIRADGPGTVIIELSAGNADLPFALDSALFGIYPASDGGIDWKAGGAGGYRLVTEEPGVRYELERFENFWNPDRAHADRIEALRDPGFHCAHQRAPDRPGRCDRPGRDRDPAPVAAGGEYHDRGGHGTAPLQLRDADADGAL